MKMNPFNRVCNALYLINAFLIEFQFKFGFYDSDSNNPTQDHDPIEFKPVQYAVETKPISPDDSVSWYNDTALESYLKNAPSVQNSESSSVLGTLLNDHQDVKAGIIEGGFTVWDCSKLLANYVGTTLSPPVSTQSRVLELGCGAGLPGLVAVQLGAAKVVFQDYNADVLRYWTIPNYHLNHPEPSRTPNPLGQVEFWAGDWSTLSDSWSISQPPDSDPGFDLILTSETIYRPDLYARLHRILAQSLSKEQGQVLLACKATYGSGGNLNDFLQMVDRLGVFDYVVHRQSKSTGVMQYVVVMQRKPA